MKLSNQSLKVVGGISILVITFAFGYWMGSKQVSSKIETPELLSGSDMEHAFGKVKTSAHASENADSSQDAMAQSLSALVIGLEKKVAANPENIDQQLLLAQTYNELDNRSKSLKLLHDLNEKNPKNSQVKITLATVLMKSENKAELKESIQMFDEAIKLNPDVTSMAKLYQGEVKVKLGNLPK